MADQDKHDKSSKEYEEMETSYNGELLSELFQSIDITIEKNNTSINDLETLTSAVALNTAKTGISASQAGQLSSYAKGIIPVGAGILSIAYNAKASSLVFTYTAGKVTKTGILQLK